MKMEKKWKKVKKWVILDPSKNPIHEKSEIWTFFPGSLFGPTFWSGFDQKPGSSLNGYYLQLCIEKGLKPVSTFWTKMDPQKWPPQKPNLSSRYSTPPPKEGVQNPGFIDRERVFIPRNVKNVIFDKNGKKWLFAKKVTFFGPKKIGFNYFR